MTNRENFLKKLNNETLAYILSDYCYMLDDCEGCELEKMGFCVSHNVKEIVEWLESEVENENDTE